MLSALVTFAAAEGEARNPLIPEWYDIIWSAVCFVIILVVFWKVALPAMQKLLDERSKAIEGNIAKADEAQKRAEAALEEYTAQLAEARKEAEGGGGLEDRGPHGVVVDRRGHHRDEGFAGTELGQRHIVDVQ